MPKIVAVDVLQVDLAPMVPRSDAIQSFVTQETPMVRITTDDGVVGTGYSYTIGTGGSSVVALLADHLAPRLLGRPGHSPVQPRRQTEPFEVAKQQKATLTSKRQACFRVTVA